MVTFLFYDISNENLMQVPNGSESTSTTGEQYRSYFELCNETLK